MGLEEYYRVVLGGITYNSLMIFIIDSKGNELKWSFFLPKPLCEEPLYVGFSIQASDQISGYGGIINTQVSQTEVIVNKDGNPKDWLSAKRQTASMPEETLGHM